MKVIKKINNNVAICLDNNNHELIAFGKGIGFPKTPYVIKDLRKIEYTYYGISPNYADLVNEIPEDILRMSTKIVEYAKSKIHKEFNPNLVFTLADHIQFILQRYEKDIHIKMPFIYDINYLYEVEKEIGVKAIKYINRVKKTKISLEEAIGIAIHFINSENTVLKNDETNGDELIQHITQMIEKHFNLNINQKGFNYSRFVTHMEYLLKRQEDGKEMSSDNQKIFDSLKEECSQAYDCVIEIKNYLETKKKWKLNDEELLYLILHVNRLCSREDCNR